MKSSALRRWLREERRRENDEAMFGSIDATILPDGVRLGDVLQATGPGDIDPPQFEDEAGVPWSSPRASYWALELRLAPPLRSGDALMVYE